MSSVARQLDDEMSAQELSEALQKECARNTDLQVRLQSLIACSERLTCTLVKICEAHLAGDTLTVLNEIGQMATAYKRNTQPIGSVH